MILTNDVAVIKNDDNYLEAIVRQNPLKAATFIKKKALEQNYKFTLNKINNVLSRICDEIFPKDPELILINKIKKKNRLMSL